MIPPDVASSLRAILPDHQAATNTQAQPVAPAQKIADVLSNLVPGQRILAEIQALLPNGNYRAIVAQRDITLALPFSAKAGDSLELEVAESDGKITLAFVANRSSGEQAGKLAESTATTLSQTGKLIGDLIGSISDQGKRAAPAPLNGNLSLVDDFPAQAANLAPILKEALTKSGVFYEAHQARWVAGDLPTAALKQEPQGKLSTGPAIVTADGALTAKTTDASTVAPQSRQVAMPDSDNAAVDTALAAKANDNNKVSVASTNTPAAAQSSQAATPGSPIPRDLVPIVQQQLDALSTQNYAWQGQIWPGQRMQWEISEDTEGARFSDNDEIVRWQTRLKLSMPMLGGINAVLRLNPAGEVSITVTSDSISSEVRLREGGASLSRQMESAGLNLTQFLVEHGEIAE